jgi:SAM-dependent methyltransferase
MSADFLQSITSPAMQARINQLVAEQPAVRVVLSMLGPERSAEWAHSLGVASDEVLRSCAPPVPPLELRSIVGAHSEEVFLWEGARDISLFLDLYERHGMLRRARPRVLDFGCGCGRLTRFLNLSDRYEVYACDLNADHVAWCGENLPTIRTKKNAPTPPLPFPNESIDLVYLLSVFTHLPDSAVLAWVHDLERVVAVGGIAIITTHGFRALEIICHSADHQKLMDMGAEAAARVFKLLKMAGYVYIPYRSSIQAAANVQGADYGNSFTSPDFVRSGWTGRFDLVEYLPAALRGWQDVYVLRRNY